jgi:6-pyruvoyltetrahydropterin/6-carboxytetrahydropterin synthase
MITCTRRIQFCAGHRVMNHESKCRNLHGHNYVVHLTAQLADGHQLDPLGRVVDFSVLKERIGSWIEEHWDHGFVLFTNDEEAIAAVTAIEGQKVYLMNRNPTAENIGAYLLEVGGALLADIPGLRLTGVRVEETENCQAEVTR